MVSKLSETKGYTENTVAGSPSGSDTSGQPEAQDGVVAAPPQSTPEPGGGGLTPAQTEAEPIEAQGSTLQPTAIEPMDLSPVIEAIGVIGKDKETGEAVSGDIDAESPQALAMEQAAYQSVLQPRTPPASPRASTGARTEPSRPSVDLPNGKKYETVLTPSQPRQNVIYDGLIARGMPSHIAEAFVINMEDESGFNPSINEIKPLVPGSRGGYGLLQWTGSRRRELEAFASKAGAPVSSIDVQLDFLMNELRTTEKSAGSRIYASSTKQEAAANIVQYFLRPATEHMTRRKAKYLSL